MFISYFYFKTMEEKCDFLLTEGYHSINGRDVKLAIHPDADPAMG